MTERTIPAGRTAWNTLHVQDDESLAATDLAPTMEPRLSLPVRMPTQSTHSKGRQLHQPMGRTTAQDRKPYARPTGASSSAIGSNNNVNGANTQADTSFSMLNKVKDVLTKSIPWQWLGWPGSGAAETSASSNAHSDVPSEASTVDLDEDHENEQHVEFADGVPADQHTSDGRDDNATWQPLADDDYQANGHAPASMAPVSSPPKRQSSTPATSFASTRATDTTRGRPSWSILNTGPDISRTGNELTHVPLDNSTPAMRVQPTPSGPRLAQDSPLFVADLTRSVRRPVLQGTPRQPIRVTMPASVRQSPFQLAQTLNAPSQSAGTPDRLNAISFSYVAPGYSATSSSPYVLKTVTEKRLNTSMSSEPMQGDRPIKRRALDPDQLQADTSATMDSDMTVVAEPAYSSLTAKRILETLELMSSPLSDARRVVPAPFTVRAQRDQLRQRALLRQQQRTLAALGKPTLTDSASRDVPPPTTSLSSITLPTPSLSMLPAPAMSTDVSLPPVKSTPSPEPSASAVSVPITKPPTFTFTAPTTVPPNSATTESIAETAQVPSFAIALPSKTEASEKKAISQPVLPPLTEPLKTSSPALSTEMTNVPNLFINSIKPPTIPTANKEDDNKLPGGTKTPKAKLSFSEPAKPRATTKGPFKGSSNRFSAIAGDDDAGEEEDDEIDKEQEAARVADLAKVVAPPVSKSITFGSSIVPAPKVNIIADSTAAIATTTATADTKPVFVFTTIPVVPTSPQSEEVKKLEPSKLPTFSFGQTVTAATPASTTKTTFTVTPSKGEESSAAPKLFAPISEPTTSIPAPATSLSVLATEAATKWQCSTCLSHNGPQLAKCAACETDRPEAVTTKAPAAVTPAGTGFSVNNSNSGAEATIGSKIVPAFSFGAAPATTPLAPFGGGFKFGGVATTSTATTSGTTTDAEKPTTNLIPSAPAPTQADKWQCSVCLSHNDPKLSKCAACETDRPGYRDQPTSTKPPEAAPSIVPSASGGFSFGGPATSSGAGFTFGGKTITEAPAPVLTTTSLGGGFRFGGSNTIDSTAAPTQQSTGFTFGSTTKVDPVIAGPILAPSLAVAPSAAAGQPTPVPSQTPVTFGSAALSTPAASTPPLIVPTVATPSVPSVPVIAAPVPSMTTTFSFAGAPVAMPTPPPVSSATPPLGVGAQPLGNSLVPSFGQGSASATAPAFSFGTSSQQPPSFMSLSTPNASSGAVPSAPFGTTPSAAPGTLFGSTASTTPGTAFGSTTPGTAFGSTSAPFAAPTPGASFGAPFGALKSSASVGTETGTGTPSLANSSSVATIAQDAPTFRFNVTASTPLFNNTGMAVPTSAVAQPTPFGGFNTTIAGNAGNAMSTADAGMMVSPASGSGFGSAPMTLSSNGPGLTGLSGGNPFGSNAAPAANPANIFGGPSTFFNTSTTAALDPARTATPPLPISTNFSAGNAAPSFLGTSSSTAPSFFSTSGTPGGLGIPMGGGGLGNGMNQTPAFFANTSSSSGFAFGNGNSGNSGSAIAPAPATGFGPSAQPASSGFSMGTAPRKILQAKRSSSNLMRKPS